MGAWKSTCRRGTTAVDGNVIKNNTAADWVSCKFANFKQSKKESQITLFITFIKT